MAGTVKKDSTGWNAEDKARSNTGPTYPWSSNTSTNTGGTSGTAGVWTTGSSKTTYSQTKKDESYTNKPYTFVFNPENRAIDITVSADATVRSGIAYLADPGNRRQVILGSDGIPLQTDTYVQDWAMKNNNSANVDSIRNILIGKGYLSGAAAAQSKTYGNIADPSLLQALKMAVNEVSFKNAALDSSGLPMLSIEEGLATLAHADGSGSGAGGTTRQVNRMEFKADDYRVAVDKAYKDITGIAASETELDTYLKVLRKIEEENPETITSTTSGGTTTVKRTGGVSQDMQESELLKAALANPDTEQYQKATTFMDMFNETIKGPGI